tara:strand:+ start:1034 stop:2290 length:1257 start_codon:yes stop_codon:yes gene_type:complete
MLAKTLSADQQTVAEVQLGQIFGGPITALVEVQSDKIAPAIGAVLPLKYNELTKLIEVNGAPIEDSFLQTLYLELAEQFKIKMSAKEAADGALLVARRNPYHPVKDYISGLTDRLTEQDWINLANRFYGIDDDWATLHLQRQLIACVARAFNPGCKLDTAFITYGPQGIGKSTQWSILGGEWFSDSLGDLRNIKDDKLCLHAAWIHEWGEIDSVVGKKESEALKKFISTERDLIRRPYGRGMELMERGCAIVGTTNRDDFLKDHTGNRRYPLVRVEQVNNAWIREHRDAIWGTAYEQMMSGTRHWYTKEEEARINEDAKGFMAEDPLRDNIEAYFDGFAGQDFTIRQVVYFCEPDHYKAMSSSELRRVCGSYAKVCQSLGAKNTGKRERRRIYEGDTKPQSSVWTPPSQAALSDDCPF